MNTDTPKRQIPPVSEVFEDKKYVRAAAAAEAGDVAQLQALKIDLDAFVPAGLNLLMYEIAADHEVAVRTLLAAGANPNFKPEKGLTPMCMAALNEDQRFLKILLDHGGDPNLDDENNEPMLIQMLFCERWENVLLLLDRGANINKVGPAGQTAAFIAGSIHQFEWVNALLERGADPNIMDANGVKLADFVKQPIAPESPDGPWQKKVADRIGITL